MAKKQIAIIGVGNCGNQVAYLAEKKYPDLFDCIYINTSEGDLSQVNPLNEKLLFKIGKDDEEIEGSGKNRTQMKEYLKAEVKSILTNSDFQDAIFDKKYCFIVVSTAGGTGSGAGPALFKLLETMCPDTHFILVAVLPSQDSSKMELGNCLEFLKELYQNLDSPTYMIYDNETIANSPSPAIGLPIVNEAIVEDIRILSGIDNHSTPYESIDPADMKSIITTPGRLLVARVTKDITEKNMEDTDVSDMIIKAIKKSCHAETDRDKCVLRWGIITYFTEEVYHLYNPSMAKIEDFIGTPLERFNHNAINKSGQENQNFLYMIASGLSPIKDRKDKINEKIRELEEKEKRIKEMKDKDAGIFDDIEESSYSVMKERERIARKENQKSSLNISNIMDEFLQ